MLTKLNDIEPGVQNEQGKIVAKLLPTEVTVCYKPYCVYIFAKKIAKAFKGRLRDANRAKFRGKSKVIIREKKEKRSQRVTAVVC